ncbi:MAG: LysE family translocator [Schwartzia sp.]|nr:LysE family translocator [Schwartzia sp. (in: firmicutes)]
MDTATLFYFLLASVLLTLAPGPDIMYLLAKSIADGARSGVALAGGLASGVLFHTALVILGVAALLQSSPSALAALKLLGALYLLYLARGAFRDRSELRPERAGGAESRASLYRRGVMMNVLNPKVLLFFLTFFPQFLPTDAETVGWRIALLGLLFAAQAFLIFSAVALCAGRLRRLLARKKNIGRVLHVTEGAVLLLIAIALLF